MEIADFKYICVGAGFFGATIAERIANELDQKVLVIDRRDHIAGNCYSRVDEETGVETHQYGSHIFHTKSERVWNYLNRFTKFNSYRHKVLTTYKGKVYSMPINLGTINAFYGKSLKPEEVEVFLKEEIAKEGISDPKNFEEKAISLIGRPLYEAFIKGYSTKQWETDLKELPASIITRLPVRTTYNVDYFDDPYQGIPVDGYTAIFGKMLTHKNIKVMLQTDYFDIQSSIVKDALVVYTGPVDRFFDYKHGRLGWRTLSFEREAHQKEDFQGTSVMNYAEVETPYTRIHEFKHFHPERNYQDKTITFKEYSRSAQGTDEPYYPINTKSDKKMFTLYQNECKQVENVIFGGRLGTYKYYDMDQVVASALETFERKIKDRAFQSQASKV